MSEVSPLEQHIARKMARANMINDFVVAWDIGDDGKSIIIGEMPPPDDPRNAGNVKEWGKEAGAIEDILLWKDKQLADHLKSVLGKTPPAIFHTPTKKEQEEQYG